MNIYKNSAGRASENHILNSGFEVFDTIEGNDMGQMSFSLPQFKNSRMKITGGYWNYTIKDIKTEEKLWEGWWNSNEEFDETINIINKNYIK